MREVLIAVHFINHSPSRILGLKSPMKILSLFYSNLHSTSNLVLRIFGYLSSVHGQHKGKLDPKVLKCRLVDYSLT